MPHIHSSANTMDHVGFFSSVFYQKSIYANHTEPCPHNFATSFFAENSGSGD